MNKEIKKYIAQNWCLLNEAQMVTNEEGTEIILKYNKENKNEGKFEFGTYFYKDLELSHLKDSELFLGVNYKNEGIILNLKSEPHFLISGGSGSGKTNLRFSLINQLRKKNTIIYQFDREFGFVHPIKEYISLIVEILDKRYELCKKNKVENIDKLNELGFKEKRIAIFININSIEKEDLNEVEEQLQYILSKGKPMNINIFIEIESMYAKTFSDKNILYNLHKIVGSSFSKHQSIQLLGNDLAFEKLNPINEHRGEFVYKNQIVKVPYVEE